MKDNKKRHDLQFRLVLRRLSPVMKKHAEILAFFEAKNLQKKIPRRFAHRGNRQKKKCSQPTTYTKI